MNIRPMMRSPTCSTPAPGASARRTGITPGLIFLLSFGSVRFALRLLFVSGVVVAGLLAAPSGFGQDLSTLQITLGAIPSATLPIDGGIKHRFTVRNGGSSALDLFVSARVIDLNQSVPLHPQPSQRLLQPGGDMTVIIILSRASGNLFDLPVGQNTRTVEYTFQSGTQTRTERVIYSVTVLPDNWNGGGPLTVSGSVVDQNGASVDGAMVTLTTPDMMNPLSATISSVGGFTFAVPVNPRWMLKAHKVGYADAYAFVDPANTTSYQLGLLPQTPRAPPSIQLVRRVDGAIGFWQGAATSDGQFVLLTNGQEIWQDPSLKPQSKLYLYRTDGTKVWEFAMGAEAWGASLSRDGAYAAYVPKPDIVAPVIGLLNGSNGSVVWQKTMSAPEFLSDGFSLLVSNEVRISNMNRYVAVGTGGGRAYLLDLRNGSVLWSTYVEGQVRNIRFSSDDSAVYVGGDPWLVKYDSATGREIWRANIISWPLTDGLKLSLDETIIAAMTKTGDVTAVRTADGTQLWTYDPGTIGQFLTFSPDGLRIAASPLGALWVFDAASGQVLWRASPSKDGAFAPDGSLFTLQNLYDTNGQLLAGPLNDINPAIGQFGYVTPNGDRMVVAQGGLQQPGAVIAFYTVSPPLAPVAFISQSDCLFNWAEGNYPNLFIPAGAMSNTLAPYYYRYYSQTRAYLATSSADNHVYYLGPSPNNAIVDVGALSPWLSTAGCQ